MSQASNPEETPQSSFPNKIPPPLFNIGASVCWDAVSDDEPDCGYIVGLRYIWSKHLQDWQYQYYIALNIDSTSYQWTKFDWGWQEDLTLVPSSSTQLDSEEKDDQ